MESKEIKKELKDKFVEFKKKTDFQVTYEQLNDCFGLEGHFIEDGYVDFNFERQLTRKVLDSVFGWVSSFHSIIMPNPQDLINMTEAKNFTQEDKQRLFTIMAKIIKIGREITLGNLNYDLNALAKFLDNIYEFWMNELKPTAIWFEEKCRDAWKI
jgi:hypothetical protein